MPLIKFAWAHSNTPSRRRGLRYSHAGFTLMEAIVAVSVFALSATAIVGVYTAVQRLNQQSANLQALQQNGRFITEDITKIIRNGRIDYARYGTQAPQPSTDNLYLVDRSGVPIRIYPQGSNLMIEKTGIGASNFTGREVGVVNFRTYIWPATNPFPGGLEQPTVTIFLELESNLNPRDRVRIPFQITASTRQYPE